MKKSNVKILVTIVLILLILTACNHSSANTNKEYMSVSWSRSYADIEELSENSDLIALVSVLGVEKTGLQGGVPYTVFNVETLTPVYHTDQGETFYVYMTGGERNGTVVEIVDDPLLQIGEEYLVFCKKNPDSTYQILGGPQGRFLHESGKLNSLGVINEQVGESSTIADILKIKDADAAALIEEIKGYLK